MKARFNYFALPGMIKTVGFDDSAGLIDRIVLKSCLLLNTTKDEVIKRTRLGPVVSKRQIIIYCLSKKTYFGSEKIGAYFGLDHATVLYSIKKIQMYIDVNDEQGVLAEKVLNML